MTSRNLTRFGSRLGAAALCGTLLGGLAFGPDARAHGEKTHAGGPVRKEQTDWGIAGERREARRTLQIRMGDDMRFHPDRIEVKEGETLRLVIRNAGRLQHEAVIGTPTALEQHAALMLKFPDMEHDEPYMAHVAPGGSAEIVWTFNRPGDFQFACLMAGHYQAGMVGQIQVSPR
ncbi:putative cupredoxin-like copper-binding protein [Sphaerotilus hippei]|uniref:Putative cupredoxin-like copper-binding protein n=1 Tax=Sphaerotilus hippei TaxID=744406 RepID=A0A318H4I1_9BURK|nr:cupredoxin family protein [Sphaerotilus hippei]PXW96956.1 putative cupredoxin-like copper-binding protein [Sphaerotilus hippei]